jgi:hypothetical protein
LAQGIAIAMRRRGTAIEIKFENTRDHDHRLRLASILKHRKAKRLSAIHKQTTAETPVILDNPMSSAVPAHMELHRS